MSRTGITLEALKTLGPVPKTMRAGVYREKGIVRVERFPSRKSATAKFSSKLLLAAFAAPTSRRFITRMCRRRKFWGTKWPARS